jgi:hypothetical protein
MLQKLRQLFIGETYEWDVSLSPDQVEVVLREKDQGTYFNSPAGITVLVKNRKFSFYKITIGNIPMSYNHMAHMLVGYIEGKKNNQSSITARFQLPFFIAILFIFLLIIPLFGAIIVLIIAIKNHHVNNQSLIIFFPLTVLFSMRFLRKLAIKDEVKIIAIVNDCFDPFKIK